MLVRTSNTIISGIGRLPPGAIVPTPLQVTEPNTPPVDWKKHEEEESPALNIKSALGTGSVNTIPVALVVVLKLKALIVYVILPPRCTVVELTCFSAARSTCAGTNPVHVKLHLPGWPFRTPSSHDSITPWPFGTWRIPSPHTVNWQRALQVSPLVTLPSSHCSAPSGTPLPQSAGVVPEHKLLQ